MRINQPAPSTPAPAWDKKHTDLKKATQQFESYFLDELLKEMRKTVPKDALLKDQSNQQEIFQDMMDQDMADNMSKRGDFGLGKMMYDQLSASLGDPHPAAEKNPHPAADGDPLPRAGEGKEKIGPSLKPLAESADNGNGALPRKSKR